jgi:hypothetical protein
MRGQGGPSASSSSQDLVDAIDAIDAGEDVLPRRGGQKRTLADTSRPMSRVLAHPMPLATAICCLSTPYPPCLPLSPLAKVGPYRDVERSCGREEELTFRQSSSSRWQKGCKPYSGQVFFASLRSLFV